MKKNFFKKLSFVLALAMIISMIAPAGAALAAAKPKLNATKKYLHLDKDGYDEFDFNIANKKDGWKYKWTSADKKVATVNSKNGLVEATGVGKTKITVVITDKAGKQQAKLSATVIVRDNIASLKITNTPDGDKLAVGKENDFNRSYVTVSGSSKKTSGITRWTVTPSDGATISDSGVFVATKAGEYKITARAFQSKAKYNSWVSDNAKYEKYVTATAEYTVKVAASMVEVKQYDLDTFRVTYDTKMVADDVKKDLTVSYKIGDVNIKEQLIKEVKAVDNSDDKVFDVTMTDEFYPGAQYVVAHTDLGEKEFKSATTKPEDVVEIDITTTKATIYVSNDVEYNLLNEDGVIINQPDDNGKLEQRVTLESSNTLAALNGNKLYMYTLNDKTTIKAIYHTYIYNTTTGKEDVLEDSQEVVCVEQAKDLAKEVTAWTIVNTDKDPNFNDVKKSIALEEYNKRLYVKVKLVEKIDGNEYANSKDDPSKFKFNSSNSEILFVDNYGYLRPIKEGTVKVTVEYNDVFVESFDVTVKAKRVASILELDRSSVTISNTTRFNDMQAVKGTLKDQYGEEMSFTTLVFEPVASSGITPVSNGKKVEFYGNGGVKGTYSFKVWADTADKVVRYVSVTVAEPTANQTVPSNYRLEINGMPSDNVDLKVKSDDIKEDVTIELFGYASNGVKLTKESFGTSDDFVVEVKTPDKDRGVNGVETITTSSFSLITVSGSAVKELVKAKTGNYTVYAYKKDASVASGMVLKYTAAFNVTDTQTLPRISKVDTFWVENATDLTVGGVFDRAFEIKVGDAVITTNHDNNYSKTTAAPEGSFVTTGYQTSRRLHIAEARLFEEITVTDASVGTPGTYRVYYNVTINRFLTVPANFQY